MAFDAFWLALRRRRDAADRPGLVVLRTLESSHGLARRLAREYTAEGTTPPPFDVHAWEQTAGHGRRGRPWTSPPGGGVYCSLIRPIPAETSAARLPVAVPVALASTLRRHADGVRLKWPNDLVIGHRKLGGILLDVTTPADHPAVAVISFGVNVTAELDRLAPRATSLGAEVGTDGSGETLATITDELVASVDHALSQPDADLVDRYRALSVHAVGDSLEAQVGDELVAGAFDGFDEHGFLCLRTADGARRVVAGELTAGPDPDADAEAAAND